VPPLLAPETLRSQLPLDLEPMKFFLLVHALKKKEKPHKYCSADSMMNSGFKIIIHSSFLSHGIANTAENNRKVNANNIRNGRTSNCTKEEETDYYVLILQRKP
jgi:hypothetical protein